MKTNKYIVMGMMAAAFFTSCSDDFLEVQKPDGETLEDYYSTPEHIEEAVVAAYDPIHWHDWGLGQYNAYNIDSEIMSDDFWVGGSNYGDMQHWHMLGNFEADANNTLSTLWTIDYSGVKRSNDAIKYLGWAADKLDANFAKSCEMQVRCLRVFFYNNLWHLFGNVPFYLENLVSPYTAPQLKADEVYNNLIVELEEVIDSKVLPMKWDTENYGRVSQAMAMMMYAEMVTYQNDTERFSKALGYMKEIIGSGSYSLFPDFAGYWDTDNEWNDESIWEINYDQTQSERDWGSGQNIGGMVIPTLISPEGFHGDGWAEDGDQDGWGFLPVRPGVKTLLAGDKRLDGTVWDVTGYTYKERDADTHLWLFKYRPYDKNNDHGTSSKNLNYANNYRYYRYSEALLYAAELSLRTSGNSTEATKYVNEVRTRAGVPTVGGVTLDDIFTERHKEFIGEGKRYYDLVRAEFMTDASVSSANKATGVLVPATDPGVVGAQRTNAWKPTKKYIPIAQAELDTDSNLEQNNDYFK